MHEKAAYWKTSIGAQSSCSGLRMISLNRWQGACGTLRGENWCCAFACVRIRREKKTVYQPVVFLSKMHEKAAYWKTFWAIALTAPPLGIRQWLAAILTLFASHSSFCRSSLSCRFSYNYRNMHGCRHPHAKHRTMVFAAFTVLSHFFCY